MINKENIVFIDILEIEMHVVYKKTNIKQFYK